MIRFHSHRYLSSQALVLLACAGLLTLVTRRMAGHACFQTLNLAKYRQHQRSFLTLSGAEIKSAVAFCGNSLHLLTSFK